MVTQFFFDNQKFFDFVKHCRQVGIEAPIIPGIKPLLNLTQAKRIEKIFHVKLPQELLSRFHKATSEDEENEIGRVWCEEQCVALVKAGVPGLHIYTMSRAKQTLKIMQNIGKLF